MAETVYVQRDESGVVVGVFSFQTEYATKAVSGDDIDVAYHRAMVDDNLRDKRGLAA